MDYRNLSELSRLTSYPLPTMDSILDNMAAAQPIIFLSTYRPPLKSGYWQTAMAPGSRDKTAFSVEGLGNFSFKRLGQWELVGRAGVFPACHGHRS
jgi:hypothetical protein